jgi:hypothetical protein
MSAAQSHTEAYEHLFDHRDDPDVPFQLNLQALQLAARRELFVTCGLVIPQERLEYDGCVVIDDDQARDQFGYGVFHLRLKRTEPDNEVTYVLGRKAVTWRAFSIAELNRGQHQVPLNRFLRTGADWLRENTLREDRPEISNA